MQNPNKHSLDAVAELQNLKIQMIKSPYLRLIVDPCIIKWTTGGSHLSWIFWEHENLSGLSIIWLIQLF